MVKTKRIFSLGSFLGSECLWGYGKPELFRILLQCPEEVGLEGKDVMLFYPNCVLTVTIARVSGAVCPGAVPVESEGFLKGIGPQCWGLGGAGVGGGGGSLG